MRLAIADPPYPGQSAKHYKNHPDYAGEVDHVALLDRLEAEFSDGWALCTSSVALGYVLSFCPPDVRIGAWVKTFASFKPNVNPGYCWEPVIFRGGRKLGRDVPTVRDFVSEPITLRKGLAGAEPGDELADLFPGTGAVTRAFDKYIAIKEGTPMQGALL